MKRCFTALIYMIVFLAPVQKVWADEATTRLREVVVTATRTEKEPQEVTQQMSVVTAEEIRQTGATDVAQAIQDVIGVHIGNYGTPGSVESLSIRGAYSSQILVLLDGVRMNSARDGGFDLSFLPVSVDDIERIEIVRGPASALYGSDAVGGVINIITKKPAGNGGLLRGSAGNYVYRDIYLNLSGREDSWYVAVSGEREKSDGYRINGDNDQMMFGGKLGYDFSKTDYMELKGNYLDKETGSPGSTIYGITPNARQQERNSVVNLMYKGKFGRVVDLSLSGYNKKDTLSFKDPDVIDFATGLPAPVDSRHDSRSDGGEAQIVWLVNSWNQLTIGYENRRDSIDSTDSGKHSASLEAVYFQDEISIGDPLILIAGGRQDEHSDYGRQFSPKISGRYWIKSSGTIIRASYAESFRAPTFNDLYFTSSWGVGNPHLKPESAREYEAGIEQQAGKAVVLKLTGFDRTVKDLIQWDWSVYPMQVNNIGRVHIRGYEAEAGYRLAGTLALSINYAYTNPVDELTGNKIYYTIPQSQAKGIITIYPARDLSLSLEGRAVRNYVKPGEPAWHYSVFDARIAEKFEFGRGSRGEVFIAMTNIFDREYETVQGYPMPPREVRGGISIPF